MKAFTFHAPTTVEMALAQLNDYQESCAIISGGTDIVIELNERQKTPQHVISISKLDELRYMRQEDGFVKLGALCTFDELENSPYIQEKLPALYETASHVGSPQIRNLGTIGGNVVNASVAGDSPTTFLTYGAQVVLKSADGERVMTIEDFNKGPGNCQIRPNELLTEIRFPIPSENEAVGYFKIGKRKSLAIVVLAVGIYIKRTADNKIEDCHVVLGAVSKHPMRSEMLESALKGRELSAQSLYEMLPLFTDVVQAAIPNRSSVVYKREGVRGAARRCFTQILTQFGLA
mgnify:CR=1 FL=1